MEAARHAVKTDIPLPVQAQLMAGVQYISSDTVYWHSIREWIWGGFNAGGDWVLEADWTTLPALTRGWLGVDALDPNQP